jgi:hypothetical protein
MKDMKHIFYTIVMTFSTIVIIVLLSGNFFANDDFFKASLVQCLPLLFTIFIAFLATQYKNDFRKYKEHAERIIFKLQDLVTNEKFFLFSANDNKEEREKEINTTNRKIGNYINILSEYSKPLNIEEEIEYIKNEFLSYKEKIGDHIKDFEYLSKSDKELLKHSENIDTKCEYIILKLYK